MLTQLESMAQRPQPVFGNLQPAGRHVSSSTPPGGHQPAAAALGLTEKQKVTLGESAAPTREDGSVLCRLE